LSKNYRTFYPKIVNKLSKICVWDPGSGKSLFRIPDPGVKKAPDPGSGTLYKSINGKTNGRLNAKLSALCLAKLIKLEDKSLWKTRWEV
jgi:hypothetical protein